MAIVIDPLDTSASCRAKVAPVTKPPKRTGPIVLPAEVNVQLPVSANICKLFAVEPNVIPDESVKFPYTLRVLDIWNVPVNPVKFRLWQFAVAETVQVTAPDAASK